MTTSNFNCPLLIVLHHWQGGGGGKISLKCSFKCCAKNFSSTANRKTRKIVEKTKTVVLFHGFFCKKILRNAKMSELPIVVFNNRVLCFFFVFLKNSNGKKLIFSAHIDKMCKKLQLRY